MIPRVLLIACDDRMGLVSGVTGVLFRHRCNITENGEFVDGEAGRFFMRTAFTGEVEERALTEEIRAVLPAGADVCLVEPREKQIVILASKEAHGLGDLLVRCAFEDLRARIQAVISNHQRLEDLTRGFGVPYHYLSHEKKTRDEHEAELIAVLASYRPDAIVLARYMRILSSAFIDRYRHRIINIHHSFLPAFAGANPYRQAYDRGVKLIGATAHLATLDLDEGPILAQGTVPVDHTHGPRDMARAGRDVEKTVLARGLRLVIEDRVFVHGNKTVVFD